MKELEERVKKNIEHEIDPKTDIDFLKSGYRALNKFEKITLTLDKEMLRLSNDAPEIY